MILAIDTSGPFCSVAFLDCGSDTVIAQRSDNIGRGHAEHLLPMIDELLEQHSFKWKEIEAVGCVTGPGSFTGLRVGLAAAKGLAFSLAKPCIGVSAFEAFAQNNDEPICVIMNAKRNEFWLQNFNTLVDSVEVPKTVAADTVFESISPDITLLAGSGAGDLAEQDDRYNVLSDALSPPIESVAHLTKSRIKNANEYPAIPLYLRAPDAKPQTKLVIKN